MITSQQALAIVLNNTQNFGVEEIPFMESFGRVLKEDIVADRDFPPFDRVSMDGIAIRFESFKNGKRLFTIEGVQPAGAEQLTLKNDKNCLEVMTGATLPKNTDTVIRYEDVVIKNGIATIHIDVIKSGQNVHDKGKDQKQGELLLKKNTIISAAEIGVLATVGKSSVIVAKQPKVIIISTGDELVAVDAQPLPHQIRKSNVFTLVALLKKLGINADIDHIKDDKVILKEKIAAHINKYDVLLFSGAVSKGKFDFLPTVLEELGVQKLFHKVKQRPGKPFWFGRIASFGLSEQGENKTDKKVCVFAFPGNPVSTFICCLNYFFAWYKKSIGLPNNNNDQAMLAENISFKPALTYFLPVKVTINNGVKTAKPVLGNGSGDLVNLTAIDGFLELPDDQTDFKAGQIFRLIAFRN